MCGVLLGVCLSSNTRERMKNSQDRTKDSLERKLNLFTTMQAPRTQDSIQGKDSSLQQHPNLVIPPFSKL